MFPVNDTEPNRYEKLALMTLTLITINVMAFMVESANLFSGDPPDIFFLFGSTPALV